MALITDAGAQVEQVRYEPYGSPFGIPAGDVDASGAVNGTDVTAVTAWYNAPSYDVRGDLDMDGDIDTTDLALLEDAKDAAATLGLYQLSTVDNRKGYAGYELLAELSEAKWDVRNRVLNSKLGRWNRRDPLGYLGGLSLVIYCQTSPISLTDPSGLIGGPPGLRGCRSVCCWAIMALIQQVLGDELTQDCLDELSDVAQAVDRCCTRGGQNARRCLADVFEELADSSDDCLGAFLQEQGADIMDRLSDLIDEYEYWNPDRYNTDCFTECDIVLSVNALRCATGCNQMRKIPVCMASAYANYVSCYACCARSSNWGVTGETECASDFNSKIDDTLERCQGSWWNPVDWFFGATPSTLR